MNNKKIIFRVTREYMKKNKRRTRISFLGILVMVVLMTAVFVGKDTVMSFLTEVVASDRGSWHAMVYDVDSDQTDEIRSLDYVDNVYLSRSLGYTEFPQSANPYTTPYLEVKSYAPEIFSLLNTKLTEGRFPENENEIIISELALTDGAEIKIGDTIKVDAFTRSVHAFSNGPSDEGFIFFSPSFIVPHGETLPAPDHFAYYVDNQDFEMINEPTGLSTTCTVVGFMESPYYEVPGMGGYMAYTGSGSELLNGEHVNLVITVDVTRPNDLNADLNRIVNETLSPEELESLNESGIATTSQSGERIPIQSGRVEINSLLLTFSARGTDEGLNVLVIFFQAFFILLITGASLILIYNVFSISHKERSRYLGMLSSIGATRAQKRWSVYYEVFVLLIAALPLGILLGFLVIRGGMALLQPYFTKVISLIASNVFTGRHVELKPHLVIRPLALILVVLFSALAVFVSAMLPARAISKTGAVENIRGNDEYPKKSRKSLLGFMRKGRAEAMLSHASVGRMRRQTWGIVRSLIALLVLTLVTAFGANLIIDVIRQKTSVQLGSGAGNYAYVFATDDEALYETGRQAILTSDEILSYQELHYYFGGMHIRIKDLSDEYRQVYEQFLLRFFPDGLPREVDETLLHPTEVTMNPVMNRLVVSDEEFSRIAEHAGLTLADGDTSGAIVYRPYAFDSDNQRIEYAGALNVGYVRYELSEPLTLKPGENIPAFLFNYDTEQVVDMPLTFLGYADPEDLSGLVDMSSGDIWLIIREETNRQILLAMDEGYTGMDFKEIYLNPVNEDVPVIRYLASMKDSFDNYALMHSTIAIDFRTALTQIIRIVAICFTILIALMSLLNLYNSVSGRYLARYRELAVLESMGMTYRQKRMMLLLENLRLLFTSFLLGGLISAGSMVLLQKIVSDRFGRISFSMPVWIFPAAAVFTAGALMIFTAVCYHNRSREILIEELRKESV